MNETIHKIVTETLETSVDERGLPVFGVIEVKDASGNFVKAYKRESLFDAEDFEKAAAYQLKLADHHRTLADYYKAEAKRSFYFKIGRKD
jgi:hypothetical protein